MSRKWIGRLLAAVLALMTVSGACAGEVLTDFYDAGCRLLFETENVTLTGNAKFFLDGIWFKSADGTCIQAGEDSYQRLHLVTPRSDGSERETGYTVIAKGSQISVMEDYYPEYYREGQRFPDHSLIGPNVYLNSLMAMGRLVAGAAQNGLEDKIISGQTETDGRELEIRLGKGESPAILDGIVTLIGEYLLEAYLGISYKYYSAESLADDGPDYTLSDWGALFAYLYEKDYGEAFPENFYELMWADEGDPEIRDLYMSRYDAVNQHIEELISEILSGYESGFVEILPDGTHQYYDRQDDYIIAKEMQYVLYEDFVTTVRHRWEAAYGEALTEEDFYAIFDDGEGDRLKKYDTLTEAMEEEYLREIRASGKAAAVWVYADGTSEPIEDLTEWSNRDRIRLAYTTVTEGIAYCMRALAVDSAELRAETDAEGRLTAVGGVLNLKLTDNMEQDHMLEISFRFDAGAFGESAVEVFDPEAYGVVPWPQQ